MGIIHSTNYSITKKLFNKIFIQKIWKLFIQNNYSFFWKIDYRPGLHQHDLSALGANVGCCWGDLLGLLKMWNCPKNLLSSVVREKERGWQARAQNRKLHLFFSPDPHWDSGTQQQKKHSKENYKMWCKSFEEIFVWKKCPCIWQNTSVVYHCDADWRRHTAGIKGQCEKSQQKFQCSDRSRKETSNLIRQNC